MEHEAVEFAEPSSEQRPNLIRAGARGRPLREGREVVTRSLEPAHTSFTSQLGARRLRSSAATARVKVAAPIRWIVQGPSLG
jgi:hypothetical protein